MLAGTYDVTFDTAGRMTVPSRFRELLGEDVFVTTAMPPGRHLLLFEAGAFQEFIDRVFPIVSLDRGQQDLKRRILGNAYPLRIDKAGRILVPQGLREAAGLDGPCRVVGMDSHAEVWSAALHDQWKEQTSTPEVEASMEETLENLVALQVQRFRER